MQTILYYRQLHRLPIYAARRTPIRINKYNDLSEIYYNTNITCAKLKINIIRQIIRYIFIRHAAAAPAAAADDIFITEKTIFLILLFLSPFEQKLFKNLVA